MLPGRNAILALYALSALALACPFAPLLAPVLAAAAAGVVVAAVAERLALGRVRLRLERDETCVLSLDEPERVRMSLRSDSARPLSLAARQRWPSLVDRRSSRAAGVLAPGEILPVEFEVRGVSRGREALEPLHVAISFWGWAERIVAVEAPCALAVLPDMLAVRRMHRKLNAFVLRGLGARMSPRLGKGREFDRLREYVRGDEFRDVEWKSSARHGKLIVKEFRLDRSQDVLVCVDRGHRMAARTTRVTRVDHAVNAAVLVSYISSRAEDKVGVLSFAAEVEKGVPQGRGGDHLRRVTEFAAGIRADFIHTDYGALAVHVKRRLTSRALVLIVTSLPEQDEEHSLVRAVKSLMPRHLPLVVVLSDPALAAAAAFLPANKAELARALVARDVWTARREMVQELRRRGAWVVETTPEDAGIDAVNAYLEIKRRQIL